MSVGTLKGGKSGQPRFCLVARAFSGPTGSPWTFGESCSGLPYPMRVRTAISDGPRFSPIASDTAFVG
jgi:hypothetical protein